MIVSMSDLFPVCAEVLVEARCPMHYAELTRAAMDRLRLGSDGFVRLKEDVREKMLEAGQYGTFYTGKPRYLAAFLRWFVPSQQGELFAEYGRHEYFIPPDMDAMVDGAVEMHLRSPYMLTKVPGMERHPLRWEAGYRGMALEFQVGAWFKRIWPLFYREPDNRRQYDKPCDHDFYLWIWNHWTKFDVLGPSGDDTFLFSRGKPRTDCHILAKLHHDGARLYGLIRGAEVKSVQRVTVGMTDDLERLFVALNCQVAKMNYSELQLAASEFIKERYGPKA